MYKKKLFVFWVQTETGIVLQNVNTNQFIELDQIQEKIWAYLDGTHSLEEIIEIVGSTYVELKRNEISDIVRSLIENLVYYDLIYY